MQEPNRSCQVSQEPQTLKPCKNSPDSSGIAAKQGIVRTDSICSRKARAAIRTDSGTRPYDEAPDPSLQKEKKNPKINLHFQSTDTTQTPLN